MHSKYKQFLVLKALKKKSSIESNISKPEQIKPKLTAGPENMRKYIYFFGIWVKQPFTVFTVYATLHLLI